MPVITVDPEKCTGCGICRKICPKGPRIWIIEENNGKKLARVLDARYCLNCKICITKCPTGAITVKA
ncbi:MAG: 4Fe-4S binding protein [Candidatus Hydrothermarchaeales archaeon]